MKALGWLSLGGGLALQLALPLRLIRPPDAIWLGTPATVLLMFLGLLASCLGGLFLYLGPVSAHAAALDAEAAGPETQAPAPPEEGGRP